MRGIGKGGQEDDRVMSLHRVRFHWEIKISYVIVKKNVVFGKIRQYTTSISIYTISVSVLILSDAEAREQKNAWNETCWTLSADNKHGCNDFRIF